jgi:hypothetical protein
LSPVEQEEHGDVDAYDEEAWKEQESKKCPKIEMEGGENDDVNRVADG